MTDQEFKLQTQMVAAAILSFTTGDTQMRELSGGSIVLGTLAAASALAIMSFSQAEVSDKPKALEYYSKKFEDITAKMSEEMHRLVEEAQQQQEESNVNG